MKRTCSWRRQLEGTKPVEAKDRVNDYERCESQEWLQRPIIKCTHTASLTTWKYTLTTVDKMISLTVKLSRFDVSSTQLKRGFNFPFKFIYGQTVTKSRICVRSDILNLFQKTSSCHSYTITASASVNIYVNGSDPELYKPSFSRFKAKLWNKIPWYIRHLPKNKFKQTLRKLLLIFWIQKMTVLIRPP